MPLTRKRILYYVHLAKSTIDQSNHLHLREEKHENNGNNAGSGNVTV